MVVIHVFKETIWLMNLSLDSRISQRAITVECDSKNAIFLTKSLISHVRTCILISGTILFKTL